MIEFNANIHTPFGCYSIFIAVARLDRLQHCEHVRLQRLVQLIIFSLGVGVLDVCDDMVIQ